MPTTAALRPERLHTEEAVEAHFVAQLVARQGWRERTCTPETFDRARALDIEMAAEWVRTSQPDAWARLEAQYPGRAVETLAQQLAKRLTAVGTLEVLRAGLKIVPNIQIEMCAFQPASGLNPELSRRYEANVLSVMRQLRYSTRSENAIDVGLFVNGIPVATLEFKNTLTGSSYRTAEAQYSRDRPAAGEPLLTFRRGALVHFALDEHHVSMTTHLQNGRTRFLPFNRGSADGGAGNREVEGELPIAYLYRDIDGGRAVFSREVLLGILQRFVLVDEVEQPDGRVKRTTIWPRYQQLDAVRRIAADAREHGPGRNYLIQHSAGSGKSNTIAWTAHHLATLHDDQDRSVFDTVVIVTDRVVLDRQLQSTVSSFSRTAGYVKSIDGTSRDLRRAIENGARIIVSTIHKFSTEHLAELSNDAGRRYAIIIDEAHSSQSGKHADSMTRALAGVAAAGDEDLGEIERALLAMQAARGPQTNLSYLAFTATPKNVTMERFGVQKPTGPEPFHLYSMRQAIEEGFILDVLGSYQTYSSYAALESAIEDDPRLLGRRSSRTVARFIDFHEVSMAQKAEVIVEHFRRHALPELDGSAKAMIVTSSREHAIRTQQAVEAYIRGQGYDDVRALVAFSGEISVDGQTYTEAGMNGFAETELPRRFDGDEYNVLVVAEKYQTGFDQPKLVAMYVDRHLSGLQAVQTLSRLNRTYPGKTRTYVLDFRNTVDEIREAFAPYYNAATMEEVSDPNAVYDLQAQLEAFGILDRGEVDRFVERFLDARRLGDERPVLQGIVRQAVERFEAHLDEDRQEEFRQLLNSFLRFYSFVAQIVPLGDPDLEKLHVYGSWLKRMLPSREAPEGEAVTDEMLELRAYRLEAGEVAVATLPEDAGTPLTPIDRFGANPFTEEETKALSEIIAAFNDRHGTDFSEEDYIRFETARADIVADEDWAARLRNNAPGDVRPHFDAEFMRRAIQAFQRDNAMKNAFLTDEEARRMLMDLMFQRAVREAGEAA